MRVAYCLLEKWSAKIVGQALFQLVELTKVGRFWSGISYKNIFNNNNKKLQYIIFSNSFSKKGYRWFNDMNLTCRRRCYSTVHLTYSFVKHYSHLPSPDLIYK